MDNEERDILYHTEYRANGLFCGDSPQMQSLCEKGYMEFAGRKSFVPDNYYRITSAGRDALLSALEEIK